jgi:hypothetical protein
MKGTSDNLQQRSSAADVSITQFPNRLRAPVYHQISFVLAHKEKKILCSGQL